MSTSVVADQHLITRPTIWTLLLGRSNSRDQYTSQSNIEPKLNGSKNDYTSYKLFATVTCLSDELDKDGERAEEISPQ